MAIASGAKADLVFKPEVTVGTPVSAGATAFYVRLTEKGAPQLEVGEITSNEVNSDRQQASTRPGAKSVSGQVGFELAYASLVDIAPFMLNGTWNFDAADTAVTGSVGAAVPGTSAATATFAAADYTGAAPAAGDVISIKTAGAETGGLYMVSSVGANIVCYEVVQYSAGALTGTSFDIGGASQVRVTGNNMTSMTIQRRFEDAGTAGLFQSFAGCAVNDFSFSISTEQLVAGTMSFVGMKDLGIQTDGTKFDDTITVGTIGTAAGAGKNAYSPFGTAIFIDKLGAGCATAFEMTLTNNRTTSTCLGEQTSPGVFEGVAEVSGSVTFLFESQVEYNKFLAEEEFAMAVVLHEGTSSEWTALSFPRVLFNGTSTEVPSTGPVRLTLNFRALQEAGGSTMALCMDGDATSL
jgi:hypothetical protein